MIGASGNRGQARRRVAFVVQRYGPGIDGGSETLCREVAERLAERCDVAVLTTTASDYLRWTNELPAGRTRANGVEIHRFPVASRRWVRSFGRLSERLYRFPHTVEDEIRWMIRQGPRTPELLDHLKRERSRFDAFVFFTYLYYPTYFGLPLVCGKSVLVPTLHDEPPAHFDMFRPIFWLPRAFVWNTPEEQTLAREMFGIAADGEVAGIGLEPRKPPVDGAAFRTRHGLREFVLYVGRLDVWKGLPELIEYFSRYRTERAPQLDLVLVGKAHMKVPVAAGVRALGYVSDVEKDEAFSAAAVTIVPSVFESLSVVALESWAASTPVLANARGLAVAGQCRRSGGGLVYAGYEQFRDSLDRLRSAERAEFGRRGREFVAEQCSWSRVLGVYERAIERAAGSTR